MKIIIDVAKNEDEDRYFGWYVYGYIDRGNSIKSVFDSDVTLSSKLTVSLYEYRRILNSTNPTFVANGRTSFETKEEAEDVISLVTSLIDNKTTFY